MAKYKTYRMSEISQLSDLLDSYAGSGQWIKCSYGGTPSYINIVSVSTRGVKFAVVVLADIDIIEFITSDVLPKEKDLRESAAYVRFMRWEAFIITFKSVYPFQIYSFDDLNASNLSLSKFIGKDYWVRVRLFGHWNDDVYIHLLAKYDGEVWYNYISADAVSRIFSGSHLDYSDNKDIFDIINSDSDENAYKCALESIELKYPVDLFTTDEFIEAWHACDGYSDWAIDTDPYDEEDT